MQLTLKFLTQPQAVTPLDRLEQGQRVELVQTLAGIIAKAASTSRRKWRLGSPLGESQMQHAAEIGSPSAVAGESGVDSLCESPPRLEGEGDPCRQPRLHRFNFRLTMTAN